jgi:hypothetical protein
MIYEMYTGVLPFQGDEAQIMHAQIHQALPVTNINDAVIRAVVAKATAKSQTDRYTNTLSLMEAILLEADEKHGGHEKAEHQKKDKPSSNNTTGAFAVILGCILGLSIGVGIYLLANM